MHPVREILAPTDFSAESVRSVDHAAAWARAMKARLHLLHVLPDSASPSRPRVASSGEEDEVDRGCQLDKMKLFLRDVECLTAVRYGQVAEEILRYVQDIGIDLVVLATHGRLGWARVFEGSVTETVMRDAPCPVLSLRHPPPLEEVPETGLPETASA